MPRILPILAFCILLTACRAHSSPPQSTKLSAPHLGTRESTNSKEATPGFPWSPTVTYSDPAHGVAFRYPAAFKPQIQFSYIPPLLAQSDTVRPIAGFSYSLGGFPRTSFNGLYSHTTLEGFGVVYTAFSSSSNNACQSTAASIAQVEPGARPLPPETINGLAFAVYPTAQAGMMKRLSGRIYAAFTQHTCYLVETGVGSVAPGVAEGVDSLTPQQSKAIRAGLLRIVHSLLIAHR